MPSIDPMLITRAGWSALPAASSSGTRNFVRWYTPLTLSASTRSQAASSNWSRGAPHVAPALLTRMSRLDSRAATASARRRHSASLDRSAGMASHSPTFDSSAATSSQTSALRDEMMTLAPASTNPRAIISPMPLDPPVTTAVLPAMENSSLMVRSMVARHRHRRAGPRHRSPGVDDRTLLAGAGRGYGRGLERLLPLTGVVDRLELLAKAEPHGALEAHAADLAGGPRHAEQGGLEAAAGHGLGAEPVGLPQDDRAVRHGEAGAGHEQPAGVPHERRGLGVGADHDPGRVAQEQQRQVEGVAQLHEPGRLVGAVGVDRPRLVRRVVGHDAEGPTLDPGKSRDHPEAEARAQLQHRPLVR